MPHADILNTLKPKFTSDRDWQNFLVFLDSHKVRGGATELWLQWEIHLLKKQAVANDWNPVSRRFAAPERLSGATIFQ